MKYTWLEDYCLHKPGVVIDYKEEWEATRFLIENKMFAMRGKDNNGKEVLTVKLPPEYSQFLRATYLNQIIEGYYMNKVHWSSIYIDANLDDDLIRDIMDSSYKTLLQSFSKKKQREIAEL